MRYVPNNKEEAGAQIQYHINQLKLLNASVADHHSLMAAVESYKIERGWSVSKPIGYAIASIIASVIRFKKDDGDGCLVRNTP